MNFKPKNKNLIKLLRSVVYAGSARHGASNYYLRKLTDEELMNKLESIIRQRIFDREIPGIEYLR